MEEGRFRLLVLADILQTISDPYLRRAAELSLRAVRTSAPNPLVGCVLVRDGAVVGEGYHVAAGQPHAEVNAIAAAGTGARGATAYVTLEPCSHHGRTPPCADALIAAGVARVVVGACDPNPQAANGAQVLRDAGIAVEFAADPSPFNELNRGWLTRFATGRPLVSAKVGVSLDGRIALKRGVRTSITGPSGREVTNLLRSQSNAVLVSEMTVRSDAPRLTLTDGSGALLPDQPRRVVLCRTAAPDASSPSFLAEGGPWMWLCPDDLDVHAVPDGVTVLRYPSGPGLAGALETLGTAGVNRLLVEPGKRLTAALVRERLVDELVFVQAGGFLGSDALGLGEERYSAAEPDVANVPESRSMARDYQPHDVKMVGDVVVTQWRPKNAAHVHAERGEGQCSLD